MKEITNEYIVRDSIKARPINIVNWKRLIISGCLAMALRAPATVMPMPAPHPPAAMATKAIARTNPA
ncbi:MAG: hypothetical protein V3V45_00105 [Candidatus Brocadiales bacterium]